MSGTGPSRTLVSACAMLRRAKPGRAPVGASLRLPRATSPAALALRSRRRTRYVRFALCARTAAASQFTKRAARATEGLALQAAPGHVARPLARHEQSTGLFVSVLASSAPQRRAAGHPPPSLQQPLVLCVEGRREAGIEPASRRAPPARVLPTHRLDACASASFAKRCRWIAKTRAGGGRSASAAPSSAGLAGSARSAPRGLTRRSCLSVESEANAASSATARKTEQRRGRGPQGHAGAAVKRSTPPARGFARHSIAHAESTHQSGSSRRRQRSGSRRRLPLRARRRRSWPRPRARAMVVSVRRGSAIMLGRVQRDVGAVQQIGAGAGRARGADRHCDRRQVTVAEVQRQSACVGAAGRAAAQLRRATRAAAATPAPRADAAGQVDERTKPRSSAATAFSTSSPACVAERSR